MMKCNIGKDLVVDVVRDDVTHKDLVKDKVGASGREVSSQHS